jgi:AcrR family transcriptional regulator
VPRAGLTPGAVVAAALEVVDEEGAEQLTLARVAARVGVRVPSLYKHVDGLAALRELAAVRATDDLADRLRSAALGRSGDDAVRHLMAAWRGFVREQPQRYALVPVRAPDPGTALDGAGGRVVEVVVAVLRGFDLDHDAAIHATRCLRSALHGFATLEAAGGFGLPYDLDDTYDHLVAMVLAGIRALRGAAA